MTMHDNLKKVLDSIIKEDEATAKEAFSAYLLEKAATLLREKKEEKSPFKLSGDDLLVNGKKVGTVKHDVDGDKGLEYTSLDGKKKKFDKIADLYGHVGKECKLHETKDYESEINKMKNHGPKLEKEKPFEDGKEEGAKGNEADEKLKRKPKKIIDDVNSGKRQTSTKE